MGRRKARLLGSVMVPLALTATPFVVNGPSAARAPTQVAAVNQLALPNPTLRLAAKCGACNPCGAGKAANPCNPCNPCAAGKGSDKCVVPRLQQAAANPCAVKKGCGARNPCAAKITCGACNPCAAKKTCSPCNPCAAKKPVNPCNPCAAKTASNPCGGANPCGGGNPCAVEPPMLTVAEASAVYDCLKDDIRRAYLKSDNPVAREFRGWMRFSISPYPAEAHGSRYLLNYANGVAAANYAKYEGLSNMPIGSIVAKEGFVQNHDGRNGVGPLFIMEKKQQGALPDSGGWHYTMIMPSGAVQRGQGIQKFCNDCHVRAGDDDFMMFMPDEYRVGAK